MQKEGLLGKRKQVYFVLRRLNFRSSKANRGGLVPHLQYSRTPPFSWVHGQLIERSANTSGLCKTTNLRLLLNIAAQHIHTGRIATELFVIKVVVIIVIIVIIFFVRTNDERG